MIEFITGSSGTGKTTAMFRRIEEFSNAGKNQVILVPEQYSTEFDKKLYFRIGAKAFNKLMSLSFSSLARQLFQLYGEPDRKGEYADEMARLIIIHQAIERASSDVEQLKYFSRNCSQPEFAQEALKLINDMKKAGISPQKLMLKAELLENKLHDKASDIAKIYYEYEFLMEQYGFKDNMENIREAAKIANLQGFFKGKYVFLDEFESFTADQLDMIKVIFSSAENVVIALRSDDVNEGEFTLFETVNSTYRTLAQLCREMELEFRITALKESFRFVSADLKYLSERAMRNLPDSPETAPAPENIHIFEARDMYSEAEYICAEIKHLINRDKTLRYRDIAVISNKIEIYGEVLKAAFERYDIPYFMSIEKSVNHTAVMVFFLSLLDLLTSRNFSSEQVFRLLKCGILSVEITEVSLLENYCYKWGIDGNMWAEPFTAADEKLEQIEALRKDIIEPIRKLKKKLSKDIKAEESCRLLYDYLTKSEAERNLGRLMNELIKNDRDHEAGELKRLWACLMDILDSTVETLGDISVPFRELADIMRSMIGQITYSVPPVTLDSVTAASARTARLSSPRIIFVMGASEGDFPNQVNLHGLFTEGDKQKLSMNGVNMARPLTDLIASERLIVYKSLSTASERLYLTYPLSDLSGQPKYPARIIGQICDMFKGDMLITEADITPDFYAVTMKAAYYHYMQDRSSGTSEVASIYKALLSDSEYGRKIVSALSKTGRNINYEIDTETMKKLKSFEPLMLSASGVENYNRCHFMYFCSSFLRLKLPEKIELDMRTMGDLTHNCFCNILSSRSKSEFLKLGYDELKREIGEEALKYRNEKMAGDFGKTPRFELFFNKFTERLGDIFLHTQHSMMMSDFVPDSFEVELRRKNGVRLGFGDGCELEFGGIVDRVDICNIGDKKYLRVIDYKSSGKSINEKTLAGGRNLQMLLYLFAATEKNGLYSSHEPAGVLYTPIQLPEIDADEAKEKSYNQSEVDSDLKTTGIIIDDINVLEAMEHGLGGKYIPVKRNKNGTLRAGSSVVSTPGMERLREFVYESLKNTAESMLMGKIDAIPLDCSGIPCKYCGYGNICGNSGGKLFRSPDEEKIAEAAEILGKEKSEK